RHRSPRELKILCGTSARRRAKGSLGGCGRRERPPRRFGDSIDLWPSISLSGRGRLAKRFPRACVSEGPRLDRRCPRLDRDTVRLNAATTARDPKNIERKNIRIA